ncbi:MAG: response regulator transcription factor [Oscillospiraceae bacterium]|nr:response regulator transcription factor [Oscillospiraceae bacterium]
MKKVLVVEDEYAIRDLVVLNLRMAGYEAVGAESAEKAIDLYRADPDSFDLALLDIMLPGVSGLALCETLRRENERIGIIMLTAKTQEQDKIEGLATGADDYVTKPFSIGELLARVDAVYRRTQRSAKKSGANKLISGDFVLDTASRVLTKRGDAVDLTQVEYLLMELFMKNSGVAMDREKILREVWGKGYYGDIKIVDVNICRLRNKIEDDTNNPAHILTVWGYGYRFVE